MMKKIIKYLLFNVEDTSTEDTSTGDTSMEDTSRGSSKCNVTLLMPGSF